MREINRDEEIFPQKLKNIKPEIKHIYIEGKLENLNETGIAIVGSRNSSREGEKTTMEFCKKLTQKGINIISGLAAGIDTVAHQTCINNGGKTIAVIGSGFKKIYPKENYNLYKKILETGGTVVSEYSPDTNPDSKHFPMRNRIISALSDGILVIEGKGRSGTTITGEYGLKQKKTLFCIPHSIYNPYGTGPNSLIKKGAKLVTRADEVLEELEKHGFKAKENVEKNYENEILQLLSNQMLTKEELAIKTNKSISEINQDITILELEGVISEEFGKGYRIIE